MIVLTSTAGTLHLSTGGVDANGVRWKAPTRPEGWEAAPVRQSIEPKTGAAGGILALSVLDVRALVLYGSARAPTVAAGAQARLDLEAIVHALAAADGTLAVTEPTEPPVTETLTVRYAERFRIEHVTPRFFRFQLPLTAADPVKV